MRSVESYSPKVIKTEVKSEQMDVCCDSGKADFICSAWMKHFHLEDIFVDHLRKHHQQFRMDKNNVTSILEDCFCTNNPTNCQNAITATAFGNFAGSSVCKNSPELQFEGVKEEKKFEYDDRWDFDKCINLFCSKCGKSYCTETEFLDHVKQHCLIYKSPLMGTNKDCQSSFSMQLQNQKNSLQVLELNTLKSYKDHEVFNSKFNNILGEIKGIGDKQPLINKKFRKVYKRKKKKLQSSNFVDSILCEEEMRPKDLLLQASDNFNNKVLLSIESVLESDNNSPGNKDTLPSVVDTNEEESKVIDDRVEKSSASNTVFKTICISSARSISEVKGYDGMTATVLTVGTDNDMESLHSVHSLESKDDLPFDTVVKTEAPQRIKSKKSNSDEEKKYPCSHCPSLISKSLVEIHMQSHIQGTSYYCQNCNYFYHDEATLWEHMKNTHSFEKLYKCRLCSFTICGPKKAIRKHFNKCQQDQPHSCDICNFKCYSKKELKAHSHKCENRLKMMEKKPYKCKECSYRTTSGRILWHHTAKHHFPTREKKLKCDQCPYRIDRKDSFQRHLQKHKNGSFTSRVKTPLTNVCKKFKCELCPYNTDRERDLQRHTKIHLKKNNDFM